MKSNLLKFDNSLNGGNNIVVGAMGNKNSISIKVKTFGSKTWFGLLD